MITRKELVNLNDPIEKNLLVDIIGKGLLNSTNTFPLWSSSRQFYDIDLSITDKNNLKGLPELLSKKISELETTEKCIFNKIAFIDKGEDSPVGVISLMSSIANFLNKEVIIVRKKQLVIRNSIKGTLLPTDRVLIISDVAITGQIIFDAAQKIWNFGAKAPYAFVIYDRIQGATENLAWKDINLYSWISAETVSNSLNIEILNKYEKQVRTPVEPSIKDFGGRCVTSFSV